LFFSSIACRLAAEGCEVTVRVAVKNVSMRPWNDAVRLLQNLASAPRMRSSLEDERVKHEREGKGEFDYLKLFSFTRNSTTPSTSGSDHTNYNNANMNGIPYAMRIPECPERSRGRSRFRWMDKIKADMKENGLTERDTPR
jgi:hypothetical protein